MLYYFLHMPWLCARWSLLLVCLSTSIPIPGKFLFFKISAPGSPLCSPPLNTGVASGAVVEATDTTL